MNWHADGQKDSRGTALVASGSSLFLNIVSDMLADCGLTAAFPVETEAAWLSVTRTQPALVICDSRVPVENIKRLVVEVLARRLPLLMAWSKEEHDQYAPDLTLPDRVAWLTFPVDRATFSSTIDELLPPPKSPTKRWAVRVAGFEAEAAIGVRAIEELRPNGTSRSETIEPVLPDRAVRRSIRLLP